MAEDEEQQHRGFKVHDRRRFSESGDARETEPSAAAEPEQAPAAAAAPGADHDAAEAAVDRAYDQSSQRSDAGRGGPVPEITFPTFLMSLSTQALALLGEVPDPVAGAVEVDLIGARQLIDILAMLRDKTRGNLDADEAALLDHALYDLRMKFVERAQQR
jgi:hypothetical protein